jgi:hypothetical protein
VTQAADRHRPDERQNGIDTATLFNALNCASVGALQ